jgi:hypothetical protein
MTALLTSLNILPIEVKLLKKDIELNMSTNAQAKLIVTNKKNKTIKTYIIPKKGSVINFDEPINVNDITINSQLNIYDRQTEDYPFTVGSETPVVNESGEASMYYNEWLSPSCVFHLLNSKK